MAEAERRAAQIRAENARRRAASARNQTESASQLIKPKVIEIEYEDDDSGDKSTPKIVDIKGETEDSNSQEDSEGFRVTGGAPYRDSDWNYTIELPPGWQTMSSFELSQINLGARRLAPAAGIQYETGFRRRDTLPGSCPYALVQVKAAKIKSYAEVERTLARDLPGSMKVAEGALRDFANNLSLGSAALDRSTNRVMIRAQMDVVGVGTMQCLTVGHIGSKGIVFLHCYAQEKDFSDWLPTFELINDSFQYDEGFQFASGQTKGSGVGNLTALLPGKGWVSGGLLGAGAGVVLGVVFCIIRKFASCA